MNIFQRKKPIPPPAPLPTPVELLNWLHRFAWAPTEHPVSLPGHPEVRSAAARLERPRADSVEVPLLIVWHATKKQCCLGRRGQIDYTTTPVVWDTSGLGDWRPLPERCDVCGQPHEPDAVIIRAPCDENDAIQVHALIVRYPRA